MNSLHDPLAARLRAGDRAAAVELVDAYYEKIYLFMRRLGHSRSASEDLTQETFLRVWRHLGEVRDSRAVGAWIYRIAANVSRQYWQRNKMLPASNDNIELSNRGNATNDDAEHVEQLNNAKNAVLLLPIKLRQAVVLHYIQELTISESAYAAGITQGTLKSRLGRALKILKKQMDALETKK